MMVMVVWRWSEDGGRFSSVLDTQSVDIHIDPTRLHEGLPFGREAATISVTALFSFGTTRDPGPSCQENCT
jgi:hypothetical protein